MLASLSLGLMFVEGWFNSGIILSWTTDNASDCDSPGNY